MLTNCNALSASRLKTVVPEFKKHIHLLLETKKDLDYVFKKIRIIKNKLYAQYPEAFAEAVRSSFAEECDEDTEIPNSKKKTDLEETTENRRSFHLKPESVENTELNRRASE